MAREHADHDIDDDIVCRANSLLDLLGPRCTPVKDVEDISAEHFVLLYHHVTDQIVPGSAVINSKRDGAKFVQFIIDSLADDIFGIPMDHMAGTGIVSGNRRMIADLLEIFSSIMLPEQTNEEITDGNLDQTNSLDGLSGPMREVLRSLQDDVEFLARSAMLQSTKRAAIHKAKDVHTQTTPTSVTSSITSPILWKDVFRKTSQRSSFGDKRQSQSQANPISRSTSKYLTQSYRPGKTMSTPKYGNTMSKSTSCLSRRTVQGTTRPGTRAAAVSRTTPTTSPEVQSGLCRQREQRRERGTLMKRKDLNKEDEPPSQLTTQELINRISSSLHLTSLLERTRSPHVQQQRTTLATDANNNLQLIDLCPCRTVRPSVSERRGSKPQIQRPMKKVVKPKPVISSKLRRKSSTGSASSMHPYYQHETFKSSTKMSDQLCKDPMCYKKMMKLTDQVKSIRERRQEINKQITQLQQENNSLQQLEDLIIKEIRLTKAIEDRKRQPRARGISVL
ncbi:uncharacterized protein LOC110444562 isoform X1 [Mizuhopecten yessoensis]|uniref:Centrosomal protein of 95 kDa n=1 Tax=Mizuhopecten yessoensis TaxID=6573 RepID=A0A210R0E3_MIZYE|nr:uncharacterized protein LOC110444562 isoform X1 [Mizuhopecten yessoensis]OWF54488.1 Centrosomal protein of 95 kDa [Mizuhopecten yessoensis]